MPPYPAPFPIVHPKLASPVEVSRCVLIRWLRHTADEATWCGHRQVTMSVECARELADLLDAGG